MTILEDKKDIERVREGGRVLAKILRDVQKFTKAGIKTGEIDAYAGELCIKYKVIPAFMGYMDYPSNICVSVNDEVVHGVPSDKRIKEGDLVSLDLGVLHDGFYTDAAITFGVGKINSTAKKLIDTAEKSFFAGMKEVRDGAKLGDVSYRIQEYIESKGFSVVKSLAGHGIGREIHESPIVPNFGDKGEGETLKTGMLLAIEPMVTEKSFEISLADDGWTYKTVDGGLASHFEHTIIVTKKGYDILTQDTSYKKQ